MDLKRNIIYIITSHKSLRITRLVEENVSRLGGLLDIRGKTIEIFYGGRVYLINNVVIKDEPEPVGLDNRDVVASVWSGTTMDHNGDQVVHSVRVDRVIGGVEQPELQGENNSVGDLRG